MSNFFRTRLTIVEDNKAVREGFALIIDSINKYYVVNSYETCEDAIKNLNKDRPDIIIMDME